MVDSNPFVEVHVTERNGEDVTFDRSVDEIGELARGGSPVVLRGMLSADEADAIRACCNDFASSSEPSNPVLNDSSANFHRIDHNPEKSKVKSILHSYTYFYWNPETEAIGTYFRRVMKTRNIMSDLPADYATQNSADGYVSAPAVQQYPRGGGWMQEHIDPDIGQKVILSTLLSQPGDDFQSGGLYYIDADGNRVEMDQYMNKGDTFLFHPSVRHGVAPVDEGTELNWGQTDGRWMMFSALVSLSSLRGESDGTAGVGY